MNNKEVMDRLTEYYLTQDPKLVARALASQMVDLHRIWHMLELPEAEMHSLHERCEMNLIELDRFLEDDSRRNLKFKIFNRNSS
jgi:hypothetical protein